MANVQATIKEQKHGVFFFFKAHNTQQALCLQIRFAAALNSSLRERAKERGRDSISLF